MAKRRIFTEDELNLIIDLQRSVTEICLLVSASHPTITKIRKEVGIVTIRGRRGGSVVPSQRRTIYCVCQNAACKKEFESIKSTPRKFCSHTCQQRSANVAAKGIGSRKMRNPNTPVYKKYARIVHGLSHKIYLMNIDLINPNRYVRTLCGVKDGWQLDHIIPIKECFERNIPPEEAASINNLRMLPWKDNLMRQYK